MARLKMGIFHVLSERRYVSSSNKKSKISHADSSIVVAKDCVQSSIEPPSFIVMEAALMSSIIYRTKLINNKEYIITFRVCLDFKIANIKQKSFSIFLVESTWLFLASRMVCL